MSFLGYSVAIASALLFLACSVLPGAPAPAPTATPIPTPSPAPTVAPTPVPSPAPVVYRPTSTPIPDSMPASSPVSSLPSATVSPDPTIVAIERRCFYPDTGIPEDLMAPLADIVDKHTTRTVVAERGAFRIEVGYFVDFHRWPLDDVHKPIPTPTPTAWDPDLMNHPFLTHDPVHLPPASHVVVRNEDSWKFTLYGLMPVHAYHGEGLWVLRAEATMDPDTCESDLERMVAGPDEVLLFPEDEA